MAHEAAMFKDRDPRDVISWLIKAFNEGDSSAPPGEMAMQEDARLLIITGRYVRVVFYLPFQYINKALWPVIQLVQL